ncbi:MAG: hypothetical protein H6826_14050 [Planctomycetes bacterium]|nr:hypothetical protein [Planctomycetota bacterium]MCB9902462.1 hypothetical protein [Planctomycetota bacterium]
MSELQVPTRWRDALSELEPAPHVLADLLEAVREVPVRRVARPLRRIAPAVLAAAALVVGGWLLMRGPTPGPGGDGEHPAFSLEAAVSIGELDAVREAIGPLDRWFDSLDEAEMPTADEPWSVMPFHITLPWPEGALPLATWGRVKSAPSDKLAPSVVRYVIRRGVTPEVTRRWDGVGPLPLRNVVLGDELVGRWRKQLAELGAPVEGRELRLVLSTDEANPVETQVFVPLTTGHSGSLVIENDLARAMRLHQFEMPGGIEVATPRDVVTCRRAWLRVKAPALGFDEAMEVAVAPAENSAPTTVSGSVSVYFPGDVVRHVGQGLPALSVLDPMAGPPQVVVAFPVWGKATQGGGDSRILRAGVSFDLPYDVRVLCIGGVRGEIALLPGIGGADGEPPNMRIHLLSKELRLPRPARAGHPVVLSSVWRGGTVIVGSRGACLSWLSEDGAIPWLGPDQPDMRSMRLALLAAGDPRPGQAAIRVERWSSFEVMASKGDGRR